MQDFSAFYSFFSGAWPNVSAINSTGPATADGTEFFAPGINNESWGIIQAIMDYASIIPDGVTEAAGASQFLEALQLGHGIGPGIAKIWLKNDDPSVTGDRVLLLEGQGVLISAYPELDAACWVTDAGPGGSPASGYNAIVAAGGGSGLLRGGFYRASDAPGTTPNIAGPYLILPESRGYALRVLDALAAVDPQGAARFLGDNQDFNTENLYAKLTTTITGNTIHSTTVTTPSWNTERSSSIATSTDIISKSSGVAIASLETAGSETRTANISRKLGITY